ncbi:hypothetical protein AVJ23_04475 [Pseudoponticoccus marisrubri]|uniref:HTH gntR-type domain-containing protein n=2 Tax=Pseudoponticoccus marisrubri TaxID=1685382 RepID=A0A0W7WMM9_9RHOB|nr:hypothetical protein AVJ23_04475 [Pseudoponticoccus marisrubri]
MDRPAGLPDRIADRLLAQIESGEIAEGEVLPTESALAQSFGVSRNVVREAIARLRYDGILDSRQGRGATVLPRDARLTFRIDDSGLADEAALADLFELRGVLEIEIAGIAALRHGEGDLAELRGVLADLDAGPAFDEASLEADARFHRALAAATDNAYLKGISTYIAFRLKGTSRDTAAIYRSDDLVRRTIAEHRHILDRVAVRDPDGARDAMRQHIRQAADRLGVALREDRFSVSR